MTIRQCGDFRLSLGGELRLALELRVAMGDSGWVSGDGLLTVRWWTVDGLDPVGCGDNKTEISAWLLRLSKGDQWWSSGARRRGSDLAV